MNRRLPPVLLLAAGMQRAGSVWYYSIVNGLWVASGGQDGRDIRKRYHFERFMRPATSTIGWLNTKRTLAALLPVVLGNSYTVHLHFAPQPLGLWAIRHGWIIPTYIYRDPRDALLSAYEYGRRVDQAGRPNAFSFLETMEDAIDFMHNYVVQDWQAWMQVPGLFSLRYEDLLQDYDSQIDRLCDFLGLDNKMEPLRQVIAGFRPGNTASNPVIHFNKGRIGRFREVLTPLQQELCVKYFGPYLERAGYQV